MGAFTVLVQAYISFYKTGEWRYSLLIQQVYSLWSAFIVHLFLPSFHILWESCAWRRAGLLFDMRPCLWIKSPGLFLDTYCPRSDLTSSLSYSCTQLEITPQPPYLLSPSSLPVTIHMITPWLTEVAVSHRTRTDKNELFGWKRSSSDWANPWGRECTVAVMVMRSS